MTTNYLRASDLRIGWVFLTLQRERAVVCVLPKPWLPPERSLGGVVTAENMRKFMPPGESRPVYYCYQGEVIECIENSEDEVRRVLWNLHSYVDAEHHEKPDEELELLAAEAGMTLSEIRATRRLFSSSRKPARETSEPEREAPGNEPKPETVDLQAALIRLLDTARPKEWLDALAFQTDPMFRHAVARHYVEVLGAVAQHMRRGYIERRERLTSPRGRVVAASAGRSEATGEPSIVCDYNDFEKDLPLHRVLVSALNVAVAVLGENGASQDGLNEAYALRHQVDGIASYPRPMARATASQLRLTPSQVDRWHRPLQLARAVLSEWSPTDRDDHADDTPDLTIPSASLWERIISKTLQAEGYVTLGDDPDEDDRHAHKRVDPPWGIKHARSFRCDIVVDAPSKTEARHVVLDAKYITLMPFRREYPPVIPVAHVRQLFAYGLLWRPKKSDDKSQAEPMSRRDVGLVYVLSPAETADPKTPLLRWVQQMPADDANDAPVRYNGAPFVFDSNVEATGWPRLYALAMSFPTPSNCERVEDLNAYYRSLGKKWRERLDTSVGQTPPTEAAK